MKRFLLRLITLCLALLPAAGRGAEKADAHHLRPGAPFGEHMVLQREMPIPVWGEGRPGTVVTVTAGEVSRQAKVDKSGRWRCVLPPLPAGGPFRFTISDGKETIRWNDVSAGEVWICCGQSNMEMGWKQVPEIAALVEEARKKHLPVRCRVAPRRIALSEQRCCAGGWWNAPPPSAVAAAFACKLQEATGVPVGIVQVAWGSSSLAGWSPMSLTNRFPIFAKAVREALRDPLVAHIIAANPDPAAPIRRFSADPEEEKALREKAGVNANIYARTRPALLYNAMLHPFVGMACRGMIYYQGEADTKSYAAMVRYRAMQRAWLEELRRRWGRDFFFLSVMLPGFGRTLASGPHVGDLEAPDTHSWAILRDAQLAILGLPRTAVINTIDLGESKNIHPRDKLPIGERLALAARRETLGEKIEAFGPMVKEVRFDGRRVTVRFSHAEGLHTTDGKPPRAFWLSADGKNWVRPVEAKIEGTAVRLLAPEGCRPRYLRYAYAAKPSVNLVNGAGLPAYPYTSIRDEK